MAKGGTPKDQSSSPEPDRVQEAKEKAAKASGFDAAKATRNSINKNMTDAMDSLTKFKLSLVKALELVHTSDALDTGIVDIVRSLATAAQAHDQALITVRKDVAKWMAEIQHVIHQHDKVTDDALERLETKLTYEQQATQENFQTTNQAVGQHLSRILALEDLLTGPPTDTTPTTTPTPDTQPDTTTDTQRERGTPYQRMPREQGRQHTLDQLQDGNWHHVNELADQQATQYSQPWRYYKGLYQTHLRELHREGKVLRRDSGAIGSLYEYALPNKPGH